MTINFFYSSLYHMSMNQSGKYHFRQSLLFYFLLGMSTIGKEEIRTILRKFQSN